MTTEGYLRGRDEFLRALKAEFPGAHAICTTEDRAGLLHLEMAAFRELTETAMDNGDAWLAERHFRLIERLLADAGPELQNAIEISYLEDLALGEHTEQRYRIVKDRMPRALREHLVKAHRWWK